MPINKINLNEIYGHKFFLSSEKETELFIDKLYICISCRSNINIGICKDPCYIYYIYFYCDLFNKRIDLLDYPFKLKEYNCNRVKMQKACE